MRAVKKATSTTPARVVARAMKAVVERSGVIYPERRQGELVSLS